MIQAGFHCPVFVAAAADVRVRRAHDEELVEVALRQELEQHADGLLLSHHTQHAHDVRMLQLRQDSRLLQRKTKTVRGRQEKKRTTASVFIHLKFNPQFIMFLLRPQKRFLIKLLLLLTAHNPRYQLFLLHLCVTLLNLSVF